MSKVANVIPVLQPIADVVDVEFSKTYSAWNKNSSSFRVATFVRFPEMIC